MRTVRYRLTLPRQSNAYVIRLQSNLGICEIKLAEHTRKGVLNSERPLLRILSSHISVHFIKIGICIFVPAETRSSQLMSYIDTYM